MQGNSLQFHRSDAAMTVKEDSYLHAMALRLSASVMGVLTWRSSKRTMIPLFSLTESQILFITSSDDLGAFFFEADPGTPLKRLFDPPVPLEAPATFVIFEFGTFFQVLHLV